MDLLPALQAYLAAEDVVRAPEDAGELPPLFLEPDAVPAPGEGTNAAEAHPTIVLAAFSAPGVPPPDYESFLRVDGVQIYMRVSDPADAIALEAELRSHLVDRRDWQMAGLHINVSRMYADLTRLGYDRAAGCFDYSANYLFQTKAA
jgi:hypothetical protein